MKIAVLGGGMSGIVIARLLQEKGHECHLFEAQNTLGGLCRSRLIEGFVYDLGGGHILHSKNSEVLNYILKTTGEENWNKNVRNSKIFYKGYYVKYPFENGLADLPKEDNFECLMGYIQSYFDKKYLNSPPPRNFHDWIIYRFGKGIANKYMIPYNQKTWNYNLKHISTDWAENRLPSASVEEVMRASIGIPTEGFIHQSQFYYPKKGGFQFIVDKFAEVLENVHLSSSVVILENDKSSWTVNGDMEFDDVVSTLPIAETVNVVKNTPPFVAATIDSLWFNGIATIFLGLNKPFNHDYSWLYLPNKENGLAHRITFLSHYSEHNAPKGCSSVIAEVTYKAKSFAGEPESLINSVIESLHSDGIIDKSNVIVTDSHFHKYGYPVYGLKYNEFSQIINNYLNEIKLKRFGRFATHSYYNIDHIIEKAFEFVDNWY